ncbi:hypothetical protein [Mycobacterium lepromatosis]|uniref:hypothetical protein n=1 Tax=Mycobacterium lepromatosis TaxID=480418 RepID=UPI0012E03B57|nr:hypothetical protein [Mycobacterium lepromatosis]
MEDFLRPPQKHISGCSGVWRLVVDERTGETQAVDNSVDEAMTWLLADQRDMRAAAVHDEH